MNLKFLFFGATAEAVGLRGFEFETDEGLVVSDLPKLLAHNYPPLSDREIIFAVNEEYVKPDTALKHGDEIAIFTAVSGG